ncbi:MAG: hypothetical protein E4G74_03540 [Erysipelotrichales bacterium]|nr:MAG: hypothetical protein E4G74_03540 [Erysipelotrichales bacterium]
MNSKEQILEMVKEGTITVDEGLKLLNAMETNTTEAGNFPKARTDNSKKMVRILVNSEKGDNVRVNIPLALVKVGFDIGSKMKVDGNPIDLKSIDFEAIVSMIEEGAVGELVTVDSENGDKVRIFVD